VLLSQNCVESCVTCRYYCLWERTNEKAAKIISVKVVNALTGDIVRQISDKVLDNHIENALKRLTDQLIQLILSYKQ